MSAFEETKKCLFKNLNDRFKKENQKILLLGDGENCFAFTTETLVNVGRQIDPNLTTPTLGCSPEPDFKNTCNIHFYLGGLTEEHLISPTALCFELINSTTEDISSEMIEVLFNFLNTGKIPSDLIASAH